MDKKYIELFKSLAQATAVSAERVMEYDKSKNDDQGYETARIMRDDYQDLYDRIKTTEYILTRSDAAKLLVGAMIQTNQLQDRINNLKQAMSGYQSDVIPKLQALLEEKDDEAVSKLADEKFVIEDNK